MRELHRAVSNGRGFSFIQMPLGAHARSFFNRVIEKPVFAFSKRPGFEPRRVGNQLAQPALGKAEIPRKPHRRAGIAANDADLNFEARRQLAALDKGGVHGAADFVII
jgi:hypothetical protein